MCSRIFYAVFATLYQNCLEFCYFLQKLIHSVDKRYETFLKHDNFLCLLIKNSFNLECREASKLTSKKTSKKN